MRRKMEELKKELCEQTIEALFLAANKARDNKRLRDFLTSVLTESEQLMIGRRLLIARMLLEGLPQTEIRYRLKVGPNTTWKVRKWLDEEMPDYGKILRRVEEKRRIIGPERKPAREYYDPLSFQALKKKYPMHFLLFNLAEGLLKTLQDK